MIFCIKMHVVLYTDYTDTLIFYTQHAVLSSTAVEYGISEQTKDFDTNSEE